MTGARKTEIRRYLIGLAKSQGGFHEVQYSDGLPVEIDRETAKGVEPSSVQCHEKGQDIEIDPRYGRGVRLTTTGASFELHVRFDREIDSSDFEAYLMNNPPSFGPRNGEPGILLLLQEAEYQHPTTHGSSNGSRITFTFEATEGRS